MGSGGGEFLFRGWLWYVSVQASRGRFFSDRLGEHLQTLCSLEDNVRSLVASTPVGGTTLVLERHLAAGENQTLVLTIIRCYSLIQ